MNAIVWIVFPRPISSARITLVLDHQLGRGGRERGGHVSCRAVFFSLVSVLYSGHILCVRLCALIACAHYLSLVLGAHPCSFAGVLLGGEHGF